jgi:hypothetical protein
MSISSVGSAPVMPVRPEGMEGPGPDHDGDSDDGGAVNNTMTQALQKAAVAPGIGQTVDKTA